MIEHNGSASGEDEEGDGSSPGDMAVFYHLLSLFIHEQKHKSTCFRPRLTCFKIKLRWHKLQALVVYSKKVVPSKVSLPLIHQDYNKIRSESVCEYNKKQKQ